RRCEARDQLDQAGRDEVQAERQWWPSHSEIEVAGHCEVVRELGVFKVAHARRPNTRFGKPVVQPRRGTVAEVGADGGMDWCEDLEQHEYRAGAVAEVGADGGMDWCEYREQHEYRAGESQRRYQAAAALDCTDERAHRD